MPCAAGGLPVGAVEQVTNTRRHDHRIGQYGAYAAPPAAGPTRTETCGIRPEARTVAANTWPTPSRDSTPSAGRAPQGQVPSTGHGHRRRIAVSIASVIRHDSATRTVYGLGKCSERRTTSWCTEFRQLDERNLMTILVTGATGNVGRLVVDELIGTGEQIRALTVNPERAALPPGVEVVKGHMGKPAAVREALAGVDRVYLAPSADTINDFLATTAEAGVRRVVALSGSGGSEDRPSYFYSQIEDAFEGKDFDWTFLRPGAFMTNTLDWAPVIRAEGVVRAPHGDAATAAIDLLDNATVAAKVLLEDGHVGRKYELSGPEPLTQFEEARQIGEAIGREVKFEELTREQALAMWSEKMGAETAEFLIDVLGDAIHNPPPVVPGMEKLLGRPGRTFAQWAAANADNFR
jgi:uncharacterized protein YbjT (DUF2867 family)